MSEPIVGDGDADFALQMRQFAAEATQRPKEKPKEDSPGAIKERLDALTTGVEALSRAMSEQVTLLSKAEPNGEVTAALDKLHSQLSRDSSVTKKLFDAMHEELKGYKDGFLFDALQKPVLRDLITLYDDLSEVCRQTSKELKTEEGAQPQANLQRLSDNLGNVLHSVVEILERREVTMLPARSGKLDKRTQKAVAVEAAQSAEENGDVVRSIKPGFEWRGQIVRPEHVAIKKWQEPSS
jgi:molecular chaperone GrpE (heat shock protein)